MKTLNLFLFLRRMTYLKTSVHTYPNNQLQIFVCKRTSTTAQIFMRHIAVFSVWNGSWMVTKMCFCHWFFNFAHTQQYSFILSSCQSHLTCPRILKNLTNEMQPNSQLVFITVLEVKKHEFTLHWNNDKWFSYHMNKTAKINGKINLHAMGNKLTMPENRKSIAKTSGVQLHVFTSLQCMQNFQISTSENNATDFCKTCGKTPL